VNSIDFGKKCKSYNIQYREIFGYVPCRGDYKCSQDEYFEALLKAIETKQDIETFVPKKELLTINKIKYDHAILVDGYYEWNVNDILIKIHKDKYNLKIAAYAYKMSKLYNSKKSDVINFVLEKATKFYETKYTSDEIKEKLHEPYLKIINNNHGILVWLNHELDEHIIECEFINDMELVHVSMNG
jgi:hypothetical protein